jgi:hypothetical protein
MYYTQLQFNPVEKQRLRDAIRQEVNSFLDRGGAITVVETAGERARASRACASQEVDSVDELLD